MNKSIRRVALGLGLVFLALLANLNYVQLARSDDLSTHPRNRRLLLKELNIRRGNILAADGTTLAESVETGDPRYRYRRRYPLGELFAHLVGYYTPSEFCGSAGLERSFNASLTGAEPATAENFVDELLGRERPGNLLRLTVDPDLQRLAKEKLGDQRGGVAAIDPKTGAVLALYGNPSYDPNDIARGLPGECEAAKRKLEQSRRRVLLSRAFQERYPPGSTFKIVTAAAGLENKLRPTTTFPNPRSLNIPDTDKNLRNFGGGSCPGGGRITMAQGFRVSCNSTFAQVGLRIGEKKLRAMAGKLGLDQAPGFDVAAVPSCMTAIPGGGCDARALNRPFTAFSAIGQGSVQVTPLQMARIAATVANGGFVPRPYLVDQILSPDAGVIRKTEPQLSDRVMSKRSARDLRQMMIDTVRFGTGRVVGFRHARQGIIGGKTGTAQTGREGEPPHVWFVAFGPGIAVAVVVENGGSLRSEATGGRVAGPIAKALVDKVVSARKK